MAESLAGVVAGQVFVFVWADIPAEDETDFNHWYDQEHIPDHIAIPGFVRAHRYVALAGGPKYVAYYEVMHRDVLSSEAYLSLRGHPNPRHAHFRARFRNGIRTILYPVAESGSGTGTHTLMAAIGVQESVPEFENWVTRRLFGELGRGAVRSRLLMTDFQAMDRATRQYDDAAKRRLRADYRIPTFVIMQETATLAACEELRNCISSEITSRNGADIIAAASFKMITHMTA